jgi:integrase
LKHYDRDKIVFSLKTKSSKAAKVKSASLASQLEEDWLTIRWRSQETPLRRFLKDQAAEARVSSSAPLVTEAGTIYLKAKAANRPITFGSAVERAIKNLTDLTGDKPIDTYSRQDVNLFRDACFERGLSKGSVTRMFGTLRAVVNFTTRELGIVDVNSFSGVYFGDPRQEPEAKRPTIPLDVIRSVQTECHRINDEARWIVTLISDTGMRLSEAIGLVKSDVVFNHDHPHVVLKEHPWRRLKTRSSERLVPLAGETLWAIQQAIQSTSTVFLFPRYCDENQCKSNSASAALNKWLRKRVPKNCVMHSFRHSFRDRLRAVECPTDIADRLGGWALSGIGEHYGSGYPIDVLHKWTKEAVER